MKKETQIKFGTGFLMTLTALFFDTLQALTGWIPLVGNILAAIVSFFVFMTFWLWFHMYGINMITLKRLGSLGLGWLIETIPYINILPGWTVAVVFLIATTRVKDLAEKNPLLAKGINVATKNIKN